MTDTAAAGSDLRPLPKPASAMLHRRREIEALIPHRWPFLLVDRIVEYDAEAKRIVGQKAVTASEWYFQGHFPGLPVMPGVLQVEALAQTMAVYVAQAAGLRRSDRPLRRHRRVPLQARRPTRRHAPPRDHHGEARPPVRPRTRPSPRVEGEVACEATFSFIIPTEGVLR